MENRLEQRVMYELRGWSFYINQFQQKTHRRWVDIAKSLIAKKLDIEDEDFLFIILELHTFVFLCLEQK